MCSEVVRWEFARRPKSDEFEDLDGGSFGGGFEDDTEGEFSEGGSDDEESQEIDFDDPNFARGEGIWKSYAEDLDIEE
jgi:hypothetical protein